MDSKMPLGPSKPRSSKQGQGGATLALVGVAAAGVWWLTRKKDTTPPPSTDLAYVSGMVTEGAFAFVVAGATVMIGGYSAVTDGTGHYAIIEGLPVGTATIEVNASGFPLYSAQVTLAVGQMTVDVRLGPVQIFTGSVSGHITDAETLAAVGGAVVTLISTQQQSVGRTTDLNGFFSFTSLAAGAILSWFIEKAGYQTQSGALTVGTGITDLSRALAPMIVAGPVFTFGAPVGSGTPYYINVPGYGTYSFIAPKVNVNITNNGGSAASHVIDLLTDVWDDLSGTQQSSGILISRMDLTLQAGQSFNYLWDAYAPVALDPVNGFPLQLIANNNDGVHDNQHWMFWLQDELGNKTAKTRIG
jgi:hypothetical protein